jgi:hypothetical protein
MEKKTAAKIHSCVLSIDTLPPLSEPRLTVLM